jgi:hypothetical protein
MGHKISFEEIQDFTKEVELAGSFSNEENKRLTARIHIHARIVDFMVYNNRQVVAECMGGETMLRKLIGCAEMESSFGSYDCLVYDGEINNCFTKCFCISKEEREEAKNILADNPNYIHDLYSEN